MALKRQVAVVGLGSIGQRHARLLAERAEAAVELCDSSPAMIEQACKTMGFLPVHTSFDTLIQTRPEIVVIATPHSLHAPMACAALRAGAHVLCEKPMSDCLSSAKEMARTESETGNTLRIGFVLRFHPGVRRLKQLIGDGTFGTPLQARYLAGSYVTLENSRTRYQKDMFGALAMDYVHGLDLLQWLFGLRPCGVYCRAIQAGRLELTSNPNVLSALLDYREPFLAELHLDYVANPQQSFLEVLGDEGWARLNMASAVLEVGRRQQATPMQEHFAFPRDDLFRDQFDSFLKAIDGEPAEVATAREGVETTSAVDAILRSLHSGQRETVGSQNETNSGR